MRKSIVLSCVAAGLFFASGLAAQEEDSTDLFADVASVLSEPAAAESAFDLKLSGSHEMDYHAPAYDDANRDYLGDIKNPGFTNDFGVEVTDGSVKLVSRWGINVVSTFTPDAESARIKPYENFVSWSPDSLKLSFGYQVFSWGVADRKNPTDNLNPRDYTVGVNPDKIPVLAADIVWYPTNSVSVEGVILPSKQSSRYPEDFASLISSKSLPTVTKFVMTNPGTHEGTAEMASYGIDPTYGQKGSRPQDFVAGGKVNFTSADFDLSFDYLYDLDQYYTPVISTVEKKYDVVFSGSTIGQKSFHNVDSVSLERKRIQRIGADAKTTLGKFGLWLEAAYNLTENSGSGDYSARKSKLEYTLGSDVSFGANDSGYLNVQYIGSWIPGFDRNFSADYANGMPDSAMTGDQAYMQRFYERSIVNSLGLDTEGLMQGVTCNVKYELADALFTPQVTAAYMMPFLYDDAKETRYGALVLNPELDVKPVDSFHIKIGADLYYAWHKTEADDSVTLDTATNAIGAYTPSNNVYLKVVYKWNADVKK